jgi:hypothetical protein
LPLQSILNGSQPAVVEVVQILLNKLRLFLLQRWNILLGRRKILPVATSTSFPSTVIWSKENITQREKEGIPHWIKGDVIV